jgi:Ca-activated chloride channel homolog
MPCRLGPALTVLLLSLAPAKVVACDVALVLAMDVSGSVDASEYQLQTLGLSQALRDPAVTHAMLRGRVAISVVQWSGSLEQTVTLPWTRIAEPVEVARLSSRIAAMPRAHAGGNTAVGEAIDISAALFDEVRDCARWVIDVSGDGDENEGYTVGHARRAAYERGITINGLAIEGAATGRSVTNFYRSWVVTPGGFVVTADRFEDFARAIREKLLRELIPPMARAPRPGPDLRVAVLP